MSEQHLPGGRGDIPMLDAATVVLLRDSEAGIECLMVRKNSGQAFGGMWVFPGGRVEDGDGTGLEGGGRAAVPRAGGRPGLVPAPPAVLPVPPWPPPPPPPRRYATWFFLGALPEDAADVIV